MKSLDRWEKTFNALGLLSVVAFFWAIFGVGIENKPSLLYPASLAIVCFVLSRIALSIHYLLEKSEG